MKYSITCKFCRDTYEIEAGFTPYHCIQCGSGLIDFLPEKSKARQRAEEAMRRMDELTPKLEAARLVYQELREAYNEEKQLLQEYQRRGHVSEEEVARYKNVNIRIK